jgi:hypothetical protein
VTGEAGSGGGAGSLGAGGTAKNDPETGSLSSEAVTVPSSASSSRT